MKTFFHALKTSFIALSLLTLLLGVVYPLFMWGVGQIFFHNQANGGLLYSEKRTLLGSALIAQNFTADKYFHPRPSAAGELGYDATHSSGSNLGPTSQKLIDTLKERAKNYRASNHIAENAPIPANAITASGSGLDPHISVENAYIQARRVANARNRRIEDVHQLVDRHTEGRTFGVFGEKRINVLLLNLALEEIEKLD